MKWNLGVSIIICNFTPEIIQHLKENDSVYFQDVELTSNSVLEIVQNSTTSWEKCGDLFCYFC